MVNDSRPDNLSFELLRPDVVPTTRSPAPLAQRTVDDTRHDLQKTAEFYRPDPGLTDAINTALAVGAPLLLTGQPGTGKTQAAYYIAWYFGDIAVHRFQVRSTSTAQDMKYDFDAVAYLREAHHPEDDENSTTSGKKRRKPRDHPDFFKPAALWRAYSDENDSVLLIDEIDKAPRDFPNDILRELGEHAFMHPFKPDEPPITPTCGRPPIVIVTSNDERRLPEAFLRRCIYHHIAFDNDFVRRVVDARSERLELDQAVRDEALRLFFILRKTDRLRKRPSTAELLTWLAILAARKATTEDLKLGQLADVPGLSALIKDHDDLRTVRESPPA